MQIRLNATDWRIRLQQEFVCEHPDENYMPGFSIGCVVGEQQQKSLLVSLWPYPSPTQQVTAFIKGEIPFPFIDFQSFRSKVEQPAKVKFLSH